MTSLGIDHASGGAVPVRQRPRILRPIVKATAALLLAALLAGCAPGTRAVSSAPLDFSRRENWAALPGVQDAADNTPSPRLKDRQADAAADVFYIHPTTYLSMFGWNATTDDRRLNNLTDKLPIRLQASAFNGCCRVYAPRYRQASLKSFFAKSAEGRAALDMAYSDVRDAFRYYLEHFNQGRPLIIASHSQGSLHAKRLLADFFDKDPALRHRLVAAYVIGWPVPCRAFATIPPCERADQTGCFVSWSTYTWGTSQTRGHWDRGGCCINPLTWRRDDLYAPRDLNLGGTPYKFDRLDPAVTDAQCVDGKLWVHKPEAHGYIALGGNMHLMDYNLFYANIRENAETRLEAFLKQEKDFSKSPVSHPGLR